MNFFVQGFLREVFYPIIFNPIYVRAYTSIYNRNVMCV